MGITYKDSGVDIGKGDQFVRIIKGKLKGEERESIGLFGGLYDIGKLRYKNPMLVSSTDGVGTKLLLAKMADKYSTIGIDLVAMCVNDIITLGARPLFFLDYMATANLDLNKASEIINGILEGCKQSRCVLLGGETAEMPGVYSKNDYELAGFAVGIVEKNSIINGQNITVGDKIIALPSSGVHSNGISLARKALFDVKGYSQDDIISPFKGKLIEELLIPTRIYVRIVMGIIENIKVKGIAHITGGGLYSNIKRIVPEEMDLNIEWGRIPESPIFDVIKKAGSISSEEMRKTFNMGVGLVFIVGSENVSDIISLLSNMGEKALEIGEIVSI